MGCEYSRENRCFSLSCCFCFEPKTACYWIGAVGLVWGGFATNVDFISAYLPRQPCKSCLDYDFHANVCFASGWINAVQWLMSIVLIHGVRKELRWLVLLWLVWSVVSLVMQATWIFITLPYFPSMRSFFSFFQLVWGIHYYIIVKTHYSMLTLSFSSPEGPLRPVPPNSPIRKHKRRKRRLDPSTQSPIRTLVGVATRLQFELKNANPPEVINEEGDPEVIVISRTGDPEVGQSGHTAGEALSEGQGATGPAQGPECRPKISGGTRQEIRHTHLRRPGYRRSRDEEEEGREGRRSRDDGKERRRRRRRRHEERRRSEDQEEMEGRGAHRRRRRRRETAETRDDPITGVTGEGTSSVTQADSLLQKVHIDIGSVQESPSPEGESRYLAVPEEMSYHSTCSIILSTDSSKAEGIARDPSVFTRGSSESPGLSWDPSPSPGPSGDPSPSGGLRIVSGGGLASELRSESPAGEGLPK